MCKALKLSLKQFERREREDPLFAELVEAGRLAAKAWWLELGRKAAKSGANSSSYNYWFAFMKNVYGWNDKTEAKAELAKNLSTNDIHAKLREIKSRMKKLPSDAEMKALIGDDA